MRASDSQREFKIARRVVRKIDDAVSFIVLILLLLLLGYGCYSLWDAQQVYNTSSAAKYEIYKPKEDDSVSFEELQAQNEDVFGWLTIYGTGIDFPLVQGEDDWEYLNKNAEGEYDLGGAIFLSSDFRRDLSDYNNVIHGHHMAQSAMFGDLEKFSDRTFFDTHLYGNLYLDGRNYGVVIFAYLLADAYDGSLFVPPLRDAERQQAYLALLEEKAVFLRRMEQADAEHLLLLNTCSSDMTNGRYLLAAYLTDEVFEDTFHKEPSATKTLMNGIDKLTRWSGFQQLPLWVWLLLLIVLLVILRITVDLIFQHVRQKRTERTQARIKDGSKNETETK